MSGERLLFIASFLLLSWFLVGAASARVLEPYQEAVIRLLDKQTAKVDEQIVPVDVPLLFGKLQVTVKSCQQSPAEESPESAAYFEISEFSHEPMAMSAKAGATPSAERPVFNGWMFAASTAISAMEHPVYDVWLIRCQKLRTPTEVPAAPTAATAPATMPAASAPGAGN